MIIVFIIILTFSWFKQKVSSDHFKNGACKRPNIGRGIVVCANNNFRWSILTCLDLRSEVMMSPAAIAHITNLNHNSFINFPSSLIVEVSVLSFHLLNSLAILMNLILLIGGWVLFRKIVKNVIRFVLLFIFIIIIIANVNIYFSYFLVCNIRDAIISLFALI